MKTFTSWDHFVLGKKAKDKGEVFCVKGFDVQGVPVAGEEVLIDGKKVICAKAEVMKCMCGKCPLEGAILVAGK